MRKAEEYIQGLDFIVEDAFEVGSFEILANVYEFTKKDILRTIKQAQIDAIEATCKRCAEEGTVEVVDHEELSIEVLPANDGRTIILPIYGVDEDSILEVANKMKEELE